MASMPSILVADPIRHTRSLICAVLRGAGLRELHQAGSADELFKTVDLVRPRIVILPFSFPDVSGVAFARQVRAGLNFLPRETSIILMVGSPTRTLLEEARIVGVDEVVAFPFTTSALLARVRSVIDRPRPFVDCEAYVGPCRRRVMLQDYKGPLRRSEDPAIRSTEDEWSGQSNRAAVRRCVQKISEYRELLVTADCERLREVYRSVMSQETRARQESDEHLGEASRLIGRQLGTLTAGEKPDPITLKRQIDLLHQLVFEAASDERSDRTHLVEIARQIASGIAQHESAAAPPSSR